ncbi:MAG TPA: hypothetical protein VGG83_01895 [Trebonia sp.]|jgi:hypothetical protein
MADDLLFVYSSPGTVDLAEFTDWYDNEHVPNRLATPGFGAVARFHATDGVKPEWLATYEVKPGTLETPAYKALWEHASEREKRIMSSVATLDRRVYSQVSESWAEGVTDTGGAAPVLMAVSMSVPAQVVPDMEAYYEQEHYPLLLAVPGWRRARRFVLTSGTGPKYLSLHEVDSEAAFDQPGYQAAISTPWRNRIVESAIGREKRVFALHKSFS